MKALAGKTALVTGAAWGIGKSTALELAEAGANVIVHFRTSEEAATELVTRIEKLGVRAACVGADLTDSKEVHHLIAEASSKIAPPDILINNVGDFLLKSVAETTSSEWKQVFSSNVDTMFIASRCCLLHMREESWGRIVNLTTAKVDAMGAAPNTAAYTAAKAAVWSFTRTLAREELSHGVTVNAVAPGLIDSGPDRLDETFRDRMKEISPTGELGTPQDISRVVSFLCHPKSSYITGSQISVAGGWSL